MVTLNNRYATMKVMQVTSYDISVEHLGN